MGAAQSAPTPSAGTGRTEVDEAPPPQQGPTESTQLLKAPLATEPPVAAKTVEPLATEFVPQLPPLPEPDHARRCRSSAIGVATVGCVIGGCVAVTCFVCLGNDVMPPPMRWTFVGLIAFEAVAGIGLLLAIVLSDAGTIRRDPAAHIPSVVAHALRTGEPLPAENIDDPHGKRTFCVRCLVWRDHMDASGCCAPPPQRRGSWTSLCCADAALPPRAHHCSVCQRCVSDFSHHCSFFGRCFGGRGLRGNMLYLSLIKADGGLATVTVWTAGVTHALYRSYQLGGDPFGDTEGAMAITLLIVMVVLSCSGFGFLACVVCRLCVLRRCPSLAPYLLCDPNPPPLPPEPVHILLGPNCGCAI